MRLPRRENWRTQVKTIEYFHLRKLEEENLQWSIRRTSIMLNRSLGSVSMDLRLSLGLRIYPEVEEFNTKEQAYEYLQRKQKCKNYPCANWTDFERSEIIEALRLEIEGARDD